MSKGDIETSFLRSLNDSKLIGPVDVGSAQNRTGELNFFHESSVNATTIQSGNATSAITYTLPTAGPTAVPSYLKSTTTGTLSWQSGVFTGAFNVKDYGALGDGTTDDTAAIQATIVAAEAAFFGCVYFPVGTYRITDTLRVKKTVSMLGQSGIMVSADSDYSTDAGTPNLFTGGVVIRQVTTDKDGLLVRQDPIANYRVVFRMENMLWIGPLDDVGNLPGGTTGDGIKIDPQDVGLGAQCLFRNVGISYFRGYGLHLAEGYYGSSFHDMTISGNRKTGFYAVGTSQGEYVVCNLRAFGNGAQGATEPDQCGVYVGSGGGISFYHLSCTSNHRVQCMIEGASTTIFDFWCESFPTDHADNRCLVFDGCIPQLYGASFSPNDVFLGKVIDLRGAVNGILNGLRFFATLDASGYHIYEDGSSGSNQFQVTGLGGALQANLNSFSTYGTGNATNKVLFTAPTASRTTILTNVTPATTNRTVTIPDPGADANVVLTKANHTLEGTITVSGQLIGKGTATNDDASAGYIGEAVRSNVTAASAISLTNSGDYFDVTSISLTAGDWDVSGVVGFVNNSATTSYTLAGISTTSGNSGTGLVGGDNSLEGPPSNNAYNAGITIPAWRLKLTATTTVYLKTNVGFSAGTPKAFGRISARRVR